MKTMNNCRITRYLAVLLLVSLPGFAQVEGLRIKVERGEGLINNALSPLPQAFAVVVSDPTGAPVPDATVTFVAPEDGPGGQFRGGVRTVTVKTDARGLSETPAFVNNAQEGRFAIQVLARAAGVQASALIPQTNSTAGGARNPEAGSSKKKLWVILGLVGGGAAAAAIALGGGSGGSSASGPGPTPTSVSVGGVSVGIP